MEVLEEGTRQKAIKFVTNEYGKQIFTSLCTFLLETVPDVGQNVA
jgi:hypothetical protein